MLSKQYENLSNLCLQIPKPTNYFVGTPPTTSDLPQNILVFHRSIGLQNTSIANHHRYLLCFALGGQGDVLLDGTRYQFHQGHCLLIQPFQHHAFLHENKSISFLKITFEMKENEIMSCLKNKLISIPNHLLTTLETFIQDYDQNKKKTPYHSIKLSSLLLYMINELTNQDTQQTPTIKSTLIDQINLLLYEYCEKNLSLTQIAEHFHLSESHLRNIYRKKMGKSIGRYMIELRMHLAQRLLSNTQLQIQEIATKCGYASPYAFGHSFKKWHKIAPSEYRANNQLS